MTPSIVAHSLQLLSVMTHRTKLTALQKAILADVWRTTGRDEWHRARSSGERVTLASLHRQGLLDRRARRGEEGDANAAYEYRTPEFFNELIAKLRKGESK